MTFTTILTGAAVDIAKKHLYEAGKKAAHDLKDSVTGSKLGKIICYRREEQNPNVLLFVHGFSGNAAETFGFTPDFLVNTPEFAGWDIFSIGYSSDIFPSIGKGIWAANPDITKISLYLKTLLANQFSDYKRIAFVAHSMGGLAVQRTILDCDDDTRQKISHALFFGTPSAGLKKAYWFRFWNLQVHDLSSESDFIKRLRSDWKNKYPADPPFTFKTIAGSTDEFVPVTSSLAPFHEKYHGAIEGNHIQMIKPADANDLGHQSFNLIFKTLAGKNILEGDPKEINILLGEYQEIIHRYLPKAKEIGLRPLAELVFALECTGRPAEALKVLQEHPKANTDPDTLGIIGGRYKRKYLLESLDTDLDNAFNYYKKAFSLSESNADHKQLFYHAINIAFLHAINKNETEMKRYAQLALDNCIAATKDLWELATIAEANLYLGNPELAEEYYKKAGQLAGTDVRSKYSIYSNAYYGYQSLMASKNRNADFLKMLEDVFL